MVVSCIDGDSCIAWCQDILLFGGRHIDQNDEKFGKRYKFLAERESTPEEQQRERDTNCCQIPRADTGSLYEKSCVVHIPSHARYPAATDRLGPHPLYKISGQLVISSYSTMPLEYDPEPFFIVCTRARLILRLQ